MEASDSSTKQSSGSAAAAARSVQRASRVVTNKPRQFNWITFAIVAFSIASGILIGGWMARARYHASLAIVAINGVIIDQNQFYHVLEMKAGPQVLRAMAKEELMYQYAKQRGVAPTEDALAKKVAEVSKAPEIARAIEEHRLNEADLQDQIRTNMVEQAVLTNGIQVTDGDVRRYYDTNVDKKNPTARFYTPDTVHVEVIVTRTKSRADEAYRALTDKTMTWETAVAAYSEDQSKGNVGVLQPIQQGRSTKLPMLEDTLFRLQVGDTTEPKPFVISGRQTWWIIRCLDRTPASTQPFDKVREICVLAAKVSKLDPATKKQINDGFTAFAGKATVQAFRPEYREALNFK